MLLYYFNIGGRGISILGKNNAPIKLPLGRGKILKIILNISIYNYI